MFDCKLNEFRKTYIYKISKSEVVFTTINNAKKYSSEEEANESVMLMKGFKSSYCKTLNVCVDRLR